MTLAKFGGVLMRPLYLAVAFVAALVFVFPEHNAFHVVSLLAANVSSWAELHIINFTDFKHLLQATRLLIY